MGRIKGRVLLYETGAPVANVVVAAFDIDSSADAALLAVRSMDRLGSAATDERGEFLIEFTEAEFLDAADRERRPDILLAIYPPDIAGTRQPEEVAPLYRSQHPRSDAGREEGFVILLPAQLLRERGVPVFHTGREPTHESVSASIARTVSNRAATAKIVREALRPEVSRRSMVRKTARQAALRLMGGMPHRGASADRFVPHGADGTTVVTAARRAGVERLASMEPRGMRVRLAKGVGEALGLELDANGNLAHAHKVSSDQFERFFGIYVATGVRLLDPLQACKVSHQLRSLTANNGAVLGTASAEALPPSDGGSPAAAGTLPDEVHAEILKRVQDVILSLSAEPNAASALRPDSAFIAKDLTIELTSGPADGPALHDFHHLQVAWDNVWTAVVDESLAGKMADLYHQVVEVVDWGDAEPDLSELSELESFTAMLEESLEVAAGLYGAQGAPTSVVDAEDLIHQGKSLIDAGKEIVFGGKMGDDITEKGKKIIKTGSDLVTQGADALGGAVSSFF